MNLRLPQDFRNTKSTNKKTALPQILPNTITCCWQIAYALRINVACEEMVLALVLRIKYYIITFYRCVQLLLRIQMGQDVTRV